MFVFSFFRNKCCLQPLPLLFLFISLSGCFSSFAAVKSYRQNKEGVTFQLDKGLLQVNVRTAGIIQVKYTMLDSFTSKKSLVVNAKWQPQNFTVSEKNNKVIINTKTLVISVDKTTNAITYADANNNVILAESADSNKTMTAATIAGIKTYNCSTEFDSPVDEALYGLGCHPLDSGSINYKGRNQDLAIRYLTGAIPVLISTKGYGLLWDNYSASNYYGGEENNTKYKYVSESGTMVDYYFFYGPSFDTIISAIPANHRRSTHVWQMGVWIVPVAGPLQVPKRDARSC